MIADSCGKVEEVGYGGKSVVWWEKVGMLGEVRYDERSVI